MLDSGFEVWGRGLRCGIQGLVFGVWISGFRIYVSNCEKSVDPGKAGDLKELAMAVACFV